MIHCLIAIFKNTRGYHKNSSYWYDEQIPFIEAAEIGTEKVIRDHSTIGIVVTTDGSIGELERKCYEEKEEQVTIYSSSKQYTSYVTRNRKISR